MAITVQGVINANAANDLQAGAGLKDGLTIQTLLNPQNAQISLTALAGGGAPGATQLEAGLNYLSTVVTAADSVLLPQAIAGLTVIVNNETGTSATAWPQQSNPNNTSNAADTIVNLAGSTVTSLAIGNHTIIIFRCFTPGVWKASA